MARSILPLALLPGLAAACATPVAAPVNLSHPAADAMIGAYPLTGSGAPEPAPEADVRLPRGLILEAFPAPLVSIRSDEDPSELGGGIEFDADLSTGTGYGLGASYVKDGVGFGVLYLTSEHEEQVTGDSAQFHGAFVEGLLVGRGRGELVEGTFTLGLGVGVGGVDFDDNLMPDSGGTAAEGRATLGLLIGDHIGLDLGGGAFTWGEPGETIGRGLYVSAGITLWL